MIPCSDALPESSATIPKSPEWTGQKFRYDSFPPLGHCLMDQVARVSLFTGVATASIHVHRVVQLKAAVEVSSSGQDSALNVHQPLSTIRRASISRHESSLMQQLETLIEVKTRHSLVESDSDLHHPSSCCVCAGNDGTCNGHSKFVW